MSTTHQTIQRPPRPRVVLRRTPRDLAYLMLSWPAALVGFVVVASLMGLVSSIVLAPVAVPLALIVASWSAQVERILLRRFQGVTDAEGYYLPSPPDAGVLAKAMTIVRDPQRWLDVIWAVVGWIVATITWIVAFTVWATALGLLLWPAWGWALPDNGDGSLAALVFGAETFWTQAVIEMSFGIVLLWVAPWITVGMARLQGMASRAILSSRSRQQVIEQLRVSRDAGRSAESEQLARLERDIHDGPQQRLVRLKLDLARIERQLGPESPAAQALRDAIISTQETLDELRALSRGIAPPTLTELGLVAAVRQAATRPVVPVSVSTNLPEQPGVLPPHTEQAAYYVVSEALTNVAKHSQARNAYVELNADGRDLVVAVTDDGIGGAEFGKGSGLAGLAERLRSVDGQLTVDSPAGGPTTLLARMPHGRRTHADRDR
ncbi:sensor histidine kinase [Yimella sp. cx-51]|uniref:sensor histidine kinase n=1 Tax=Yimella sp. cx-51 TaxID=2770551 RepID=UPI00165E860D|nr:sensor histidine kinase [Yimella sp. cx-51]MBC9956306.1 sensor histidine kinase [Yimella sp. cx-51]QTH38559.1 sensor histidine kinase [Yimella sp. cx-51]